MAKYLSQEWLDLQRELAADLPERPGATAVVQYVVSGTPDGDVSFAHRFVDGRLVGSTLGTDADADVTLLETYADSLQIAQGDLDANAAFMQGRVKVTGDMGKLMSLMPLTQSDDYKELTGQLAERTEF
ncbi:MAG TPA: SCP2 sterol-binding domain-containing protein [Acidimicrobiales bacterium]